jgi:hypothetical protein
MTARVILPSCIQTTSPRVSPSISLSTDCWLSWAKRSATSSTTSIPRLGLPDSNGQHDQLVHHMQQRILQRIQPLHWQSRSNRGAITLFARLDIGHADFEGQQFVYCKPFSVHKETKMDHVFFIPPLPFYDVTVAWRRRHREFDLALDSVWIGRVALLFK